MSRLLALTGVRAAAAAALAPVDEGDPPVFPYAVEALTPPALVLEWGEPWLAPRTIAGPRGLLDALLNLYCFASRLEPDVGEQMVDALVVYALGRLELDVNVWPLATAQSTRRFDIGNMTLLGARLTFRVPVSINGGP